MSPLWLLALLALTPGVPGGPEVCPGVCPSVCPGCPGVHPAVSPAVCPGCPGVCPGPALPLPVPDGLSRLRPVPPGTLPELLRRFPVLALLRSPGGSGHRAQELRALELVAQALEPRGVGFGIVDTDTEPELAREWGLAGRWRLALLRGHSVTEYPGELAVPALLRFLSQVLPQQLRDFGDIEEEPEGTGDCWGQRRPSSPSSSPGASTPPSSSSPHSTPRAPLRQLRAQSTAGSWEDAMLGTPIVAFAVGDDPDGFEFVETLREVAQDRRDQPDFSILWIDPGDFPGLVPIWEDTFDIDLSRPQLGVVNGTDLASSVWLDMEDEEDLPGPEEVLEWLQEVLEGDTGDGEDEEDDDDDDDEDYDDHDDEDEDDEEDEDDDDEVDAD
ncbi:calsequestrin-1 isoform X2 [Zonotrichia albicollis]|uniref:calsequestrin-1 isoform X2 n=1 Tax=Zonotrichia albicollis TaxID=44394 RepID=UPI003D80F984